ncbi:MAG TPA: hypothetical protein VN083_00120 [Vicinamibacteria bacterium]|nr:hypothetical protein [Vicinamibacteria bacterium]
MNMPEFSRQGQCDSCGTKYDLTGSALNPANETQSAMVFSCACGGRVVVQVPGSVNRSLVRMEPTSD